jgi:hypothetical protein
MSTYQTVPSLGFKAIAVYSDKAREGKQGKTLSLQDKGAERYAGGRLAGRASISGWMRGSDSPYVETIMHGRTLSDDSPVRGAGGVRRTVDDDRGRALQRRCRNTLDQVQARNVHAPHATRKVLRRGDCPARCLESVLLAEGLCVGAPWPRERGDVCREARAGWRAGPRPASRC